LLAHLVIPHSTDMTDDEVFYVAVHDGHRNSWNTSPSAPMTITRAGNRNREPEILGNPDPNDDDLFAHTLGEWTRLVPYRR
jgi:hypothetical protein